MIFEFTEQKIWLMFYTNQHILQSIHFSLVAKVKFTLYHLEERTVFILRILEGKTMTFNQLQ